MTKLSNEELEAIRLAEIERRRSYIPTEWGGNADMEYVQRRVAPQNYPLDITGNKDVRIEYLSGNVPPVSEQNRRYIPSLISKAEAADIPVDAFPNRGGDFNPPGTLVGRLFRSAIDGLKPDFPPEPGGNGVVAVEGPDGIEPPPPGPSNTESFPSTHIAANAIQNGSNIWYQKDAILKAQQDAIERDGLEKDFLLGGGIIDFIRKPEVQNILEIMARPEFIEGSFTSGALGPYARAADAQKKSDFQANQIRLDRALQEADLAAQREATAYSREQDRAQLGLERRRVELAEDPLPKPPTINKTTIEAMVDLIASLESNGVVDIDDLTGLGGFGILGQRESTVRQAIALRALEIQKNSPETSSADAIKQSIDEIRGKGEAPANGDTPSAPNGSISGATKGNLNISGDLQAIVE